MEWIKIFVIPLSLAILGYLAKGVFDLIVEKRERKFKLYEMQLSQFYWPIYIRLHNNDSVWVRMLNKGEKYDSKQNKIAESIEKDVILRNHIEIEDILKSYIHIAFPDNILIDAIKDYLKHVEVYKAIKAASINDKYPADFKADYPTHFARIIEDRTFYIQNKLNRLYKNKWKKDSLDFGTNFKKENSLIGNHYIKQED